MTNIKVDIEESWKEALLDEFEKPYFIELTKFLREEKKNQTIYPPGSMIFSAFNYTPLASVKVVILGQDPYHGEGQAHGLSFSVPKGIALPPSLRNIYKELREDIGIVPPTSGCLQGWAKQGVLLLNTTLTVRKVQAFSHAGKGWETFTDEVIKVISKYRAGIVFILWGKHAQKKATLIDTSKHFILTSAHPSPLSAYNGFFGCKHFSKTNEILQNNGLETINWELF
jgi:uracil-DNA glycosylase